MDNISRLKSIDETYCRLWKSRYENTASSLSGAKTLLNEAQKAKYDKGIAYSHLIIAACSFLLSKNDQAQENLSEAYQWFINNTSEPGYICALTLKSNIYESFGDYENALKYCFEAYNLATEKGDSELEAEALSQLGLIYSRLGNYEKALDYHNECLKIREEFKDENGIASSLNRIGMIMRLTKKYDESLDYYNKSLELRRKNGQITSIPWTLLGIASTYEEMGKTNEALDFYLNGKIGADKRCVLQCIMGMGRIYHLLGKQDLAEEKLSESLKMALTLNAQSLVADAYFALAKHYESIGQEKKALENFKLFQQTMESVKSDEFQTRFRNIEISHAVEKSEKEKEIFRLRHVELKQAYDIIEEKNIEITASINYARRIQQAILPKTSEIKGLSERIFILYKPKDIISGDFYWFKKAGRKLIICAGDCTGHGVPGALMSMLGISFLEEIISYRKISNSALILNELRKEVQRALHQKGIRDEAKDGMDISLCVIDNFRKIIQYSGANNNLYMVRNGEFSECTADRMPIGIYDLEDKDFSAHDIPYLNGDMIYMHSDGYADQFGGPDHKKFKSSTLKTLLTEIYNLPLPQQKEVLEKRFSDWKGNNFQIDDVLVMGLRM
jgi:serine phosphatase RsbU (regulator of sigma subunit)